MSEYKLRTMRERGDGPKYFRDGNLWKYRKSDLLLDEWLAERVKPGAEPLPITPRKPRVRAA